MLNPPAFLLLGRWVSIGLHYKCCEVWALLGRWLITGLLFEMSGLSPAWPGSDRCPTLRLSFRTLHWRCGTRHDSPFAPEKASGGRFKCKCLQHLTSGGQRGIYWGSKIWDNFQLINYHSQMFLYILEHLSIVLSLFCYELHKLNLMIMLSSMTWTWCKKNLVL